jgi:ElaB/YqjD/DUF883 family membrane-anchored ribosome-binding protein
MISRYDAHNFVAHFFIQESLLMVTGPHNKTTDKVTKAAHEAIDKMATSADQVERRIRQTATDAQVNMRGTTDRAQRMSEDVITDIRQYMYERPVASIVMAFAAGIIFSAILRR